MFEDFPDRLCGEDVVLTDKPRLCILFFFLMSSFLFSGTSCFGKRCVHICSIAFFSPFQSASTLDQQIKGSASPWSWVLLSPRRGEWQTGRPATTSTATPTTGKLTTVELFLRRLIRLRHSLLQEHDGALAWSDIINLKLAGASVSYLALRRTRLLPKKTSSTLNMMIKSLDLTFNSTHLSPGKSRNAILYLSFIQHLSCFFLDSVHHCFK